MERRGGKGANENKIGKGDKGQGWGIEKANTDCDAHIRAADLEPR